MKKYLQYLHYLLRHKWYVFIECYKYNIIWRGIIHDLSKFRLDEIIPYANHFYAEPTYNSKSKFFDAWKKHYRRNRHHWQYWCDKHVDNPINMEYSSILEMVADWRAMGKMRGKSSPVEWYEANKNNIVVTDKTRKIIEILLNL